MLCETFSFQNYQKAVDNLIEYDEQKEYWPVVKEYLEILSSAIEDLQQGGTSRYKNIFEDASMEKYHNIDNYILSQVMHGYVSVAPLELSNEQWFRVFRMILLNYKIMICVFETVDLTLAYESNDITEGNGQEFARDLLYMFQKLHRKYRDYLPDGVSNDEWPLMCINDQARKSWRSITYVNLVLSGDESWHMDSDED
ncbi:orf64-like protein [Peridroma alphabaculovirus]|uniref:Orf64-like protein n=1 Tax=Peridroma alphabaculovirus TaxID=1346829 RepID=A0A068LRL5_9ABAC|nr:orf64-like protein [Peridroma alphabaculovirus]AIE47820.1 orf64-like protein [Peridroma alphabaculovirus]